MFSNTTSYLVSVKKKRVWSNEVRQMKICQMEFVCQMKFRQIKCFSKKSLFSKNKVSLKNVEKFCQKHKQKYFPENVKKK